MTDTWMYPRITDYWEEEVRAIDTGAQRLAALPEDARPAAVTAIRMAVTEHVRVLTDEVLADVTVTFADDLYKAACAIKRWDDALDQYLTASAGTLTARLAERGFFVQYLVDNAWEDLSKPLHLLPNWYRAAGFVFACPVVMVFQLAEADGVDAAADVPRALGHYGQEARDVVDKVIDRCHQERLPFVQLDTDMTTHSFDVAFSARGKAGVITVFRNLAPEPCTTVQVWMPSSQD